MLADTTHTQRTKPERKAQWGVPISETQDQAIPMCPDCACTCLAGSPHCRHDVSRPQCISVLLLIYHRMDKKT